MHWKEGIKTITVFTQENRFHCYTVIYQKPVGASVLMSYNSRALGTELGGSYYMLLDLQTTKSMVNIRLCMEFYMGYRWQIDKKLNACSLLGSNFLPGKVEYISTDGNERTLLSKDEKLQIEALSLDCELETEKQKVPF